MLMGSTSTTAICFFKKEKNLLKVTYVRAQDNILIIVKKKKVLQILLECYIEELSTAKQIYS